MSFNTNNTDIMIVEIELERNRRKRKQLLEEMRRKMDWLTLSFQGTAAWLSTNKNEVSDITKIK